jgi:uncharacterized membrane protein
VILTLTTQQFGPRLLRTLFHDTGTKVVLGTLIGTFIYALVVLRSIHGDGANALVPVHAVTAGVAFGVASIGALIYFIHHIAVSIQASAIVERVSRDLHGQIAQLFPYSAGEAPPDPPIDARDRLRVDRLAEQGASIRSPVEGYVRLIDLEALVEASAGADALVQVIARPGAFVHRGGPLAIAMPPDAAGGGASKRLAAAFVVGRDQTEAQDPLFAIDQLTEVAVRALSPGINDPFTAMNVIDRLGAALADLADRAPASPFRFAPDGRLRVVARPITFDDAIRHAFGPIARYGAQDPAVLRCLLGALGMLADGTRTEAVRTSVLEHAGVVQRLALAASFDEWYERPIVEQARRLIQRLSGGDASLRRTG